MKIVEETPAAEMPQTRVMDAEANHRIANNLSLLVSQVRLRAAAVAREPQPMSGSDVSRLLRGVASQIESVGRLHRLLSGIPGGDTIDLDVYLGDICAAMAAAHTDTELSCALESCTVSPEVALNLGQMVGELVANAIKYAHPAGVRGRVAVRSRIDPDGTIRIEVEDDGVGLPAGFDANAHGGTGFRVLGAIARQIGATTHYITSELGLCCRIVLPVSAKRPAPRTH